jgi:hypothetical protein
MTHDEFYSSLLENRRLIQPPRFGPRRERRAWVARASMADGAEGVTAPATQGDLWRPDDDPLRADDQTYGPSVGGRVVGRIAGGRIIPMGDDE